MFGITGFSAAPFSDSGGPGTFIVGVSATGAVGSVSINGEADAIVTGLQAVAETSGVVFNESFDVGGVFATASVGSAEASVPVSVSVTGLSASMPMTTLDEGGSLLGGLALAEEPIASLGDGELGLSFVLGAVATLSGLEASAAVGGVSAIGSAVAAVTGLSAAGSVDSVSVIGEANVSPTGLAATGTPGAVTVVEGTGLNVAITSPRLQGQVGIVAPNAQIKVFLTGVVGTGETSGASVVSWNEIIVNQDPNWVEIAA